MKKKSAILGFILVVSASKIFAQTYQSHFPKLVFKYDWRGKSLDLIGRWSLDGVTLAQLKEQYDLLSPELVRSCEHDLPLFFEELFSVFNRGIKAKERTVLISLTNRWSYGSHRFLVLGLRNILDPSPWCRKGSRSDEFTTTMFHELLHVWVDENVSQESPLVKKYSKEDIVVNAHIHLMALQKMVYLNLNRPDLLEMIDDGYRNYAPLSYKRAWEIVNDIEGYEAVLKDITHCKNLEA
ncbi:MAG: hypothetical protein AB7F19_06510 [Candidatus Babeliales bacterium]